MADKEQPQLLDERIISNRGVVLWTPDSRYRRFWLYCQVFRDPQINFVNKNWNPDKSQYANLTWSRGNQIIREDVVHFARQNFVFDVDQTGYLSKYLQCRFADIEDLLINISTALGLTSGEAEAPFCEPIQDQFDRIRIVVRPDAAMAVQLYGLKYDIACPQAEQEEQPPPPPPALPPVPPGEPLEDSDNPASPPYDPPSDGGDTVPLPDDDAPSPPPDPEPPGQRCVPYRVTLKVYGDWGDPDGGTGFERFKIFTVDCYGEVELTRVTPGTGCRLSAHGEPPTCTEESANVFISQQPENVAYPDPEIVGFDPL